MQLLHFYDLGHLINIQSMWEFDLQTDLVDIVSVHGEWLIRTHLVGSEQPIPYMKWRITCDLPEGPITNQLQSPTK